jgi:hypothetical protein
MFEGDYSQRTSHEDILYVFGAVDNSGSGFCRRAHQRPADV